MGLPPPASRRRAQHFRSEAGSTRWEIALREPADALRPYLRELYGYSESTPGPVVSREFPGPQVVVIIELGPPIRVHDALCPERWGRYAGGFVAGLDERPSQIAHDGHQRGLQVNFTPLGARLFFGLPMSELTGRVVHLRELLPREHHTLAERLESLPDWDARFDLVERVVAEQVGRARDWSRPAAWALERIVASGGAVEVGALARELGYSHKHLIALFRDHVGAPPKLLARLVRFDRLLQHLKRRKGGSWAQLALEFGFYDQAHLVREVRHFTGTTPTEARSMLIDLSGPVS